MRNCVPILYSHSIPCLFFSFIKESSKRMTKRAIVTKLDQCKSKCHRYLASKAWFCYYFSWRVDNAKMSPYMYV